MQQVIWDEFEEDISVSTIWRMLKSRGWNRKLQKTRSRAILPCTKRMESKTSWMAFTSAGAPR